jgi:CRISPR-associated protein Csb2
MLALKFNFLAGRYHATPWGRHVNEGDVAWPPEPLRLIRALIATWHLRMPADCGFDRSQLDQLIEKLCSAMPAYHLPTASHSHTRHYLPQWKAGDTSLVLDAFAAVNPEQALFCCWADLELSAEELSLLDVLLENLGYLGRAESWVEAQRVEDLPKLNCGPADRNVDDETGELLGEIIDLLSPVSPATYAERRAQLLNQKKVPKKVRNTLPETLVEALSIDTSDLQKAGWNLPPATQTVQYLRPVEALRPKRTAPKSARARFTTGCWLVIGNPKPRIEDTLRIGEAFRNTALAAFGRDDRNRHLAPSILSGHGLADNNIHRHAFFLPRDADDDGYIDQLVLHVPDGIEPEWQETLTKAVRRVWHRNGGWDLLAAGFGTPLLGGELLDESRCWISVTPYLHPWHTKKKFSVEDQIRKECCVRGLPEPDLNPRPHVMIRGRQRRPMHFHRFRSNKPNLSQPDTRGSFWQLTFPEPVHGPIALGFGCHFGLGLFASGDED